MFGKCKTNVNVKKNVFKRSQQRSAVKVRIQLQQTKQLWKSSSLKSQDQLSWVFSCWRAASRPARGGCGPVNHRSPDRSDKVSWIFLILCQTSHCRKTARQSVNWYSPRDSPRCAVKPGSVLWLWRCRLVLLKSCLISRPWNGGCGKGLAAADKRGMINRRKASRLPVSH